MIHKTLPKTILLFSLITLMGLSSCKKDSNNVTDPTIIEEKWEILITFYITDPDVYSFTETGDLDVVIEGKNVTITGVYTIGNLTYEDIVFYGTVEDDQFTLDTNTYQVQFEFDGITYTEVLTFTISEYTQTETGATGSGDIHVVKTPGNTTESGTFTFVATKK